MPFIFIPFLKKISYSLFRILLLALNVPLVRAVRGVMSTADIDASGGEVCATKGNTGIAL